MKKPTKIITISTVCALATFSYIWIISEAPSLQEESPVAEAIQEQKNLNAFPEPLQNPVLVPKKDSLLDQLTQGDQELIETLEIDDRALAFAKLDFEALKQDMPDNIYWEMAVPTSDEDIKQHRKEQREFWDLREGKISSSLATEEEIREFYIYQNELSEDYVEVTSAIIKKHGQELPEQDYTMLTLSLKLHLSRLQDMPNQLTQALDNRTRYLERKAEWLADKEAYRAKLEAQRDAALKEMSQI